MATKADLVAHLASKVDGLDKQSSAQVVDAVFEAVAHQLANGERVQLPGFGTFKLTKRAARQGRHPLTGAPIDLPASTGVRFKPSATLRSSLPGNPTTLPRRSKPRPKRLSGLAGSAKPGGRKGRA